VIERITRQYGEVIDLNRSPGVMIEILREFGANMGPGDGGVSSVSTIAVGVGTPGSGTVLLEDLMRVVLDLRQEVIKLSERVQSGRRWFGR